MPIDRDTRSERDVIKDNQDLQGLAKSMGITHTRLTGQTVPAPSLAGIANDPLAVNQAWRGHIAQLVEKLAVCFGSDMERASAKSVEESIQHIEQLRGENIGLTARVSELEAQNTELRKQVADRDELVKAAEAKCSNFQTAVAEAVAVEVAGLGIRPRGITQPKAGNAVIPTGPEAAPSQPAAGSPVAPEKTGTGKNWTAMCEQAVAANGRVLDSADYFSP